MDTSLRSVEPQAAIAPKKRFVPCPYCHGAGGHTEYVPGLGDGPHYDCGGCGGTGNLHDYVRLEAERKAHWTRCEAAMCECGHDAGCHYDAFDHCAFDLEPDAEGFIYQCQCLRSRETVLAIAENRGAKSTEPQATCPNEPTKGPQ